MLKALAIAIIQPHPRASLKNTYRDTKIKYKYGVWTQKYGRTNNEYGHTSMDTQIWTHSTEILNSRTAHKSYLLLISHIKSYRDMTLLTATITTYLIDSLKANSLSNVRHFEARALLRAV